MPEIESKGFSTDTKCKRIVIIGGGIIGCTTAFYLSTHPSFSRSDDSITLLEPSVIAGGASGKAGGLVARWAYPSALAKLSFEEHRKLAEKYDGEKRWGHRGNVECGSWEGKGDPSFLLQTVGAINGKANGVADKEGKLGHTAYRSAKPRKSSHPEDLNLIPSHLTTSYDPVAPPRSGDTAQVHPYQFTTSMASLAEEHGVKIIRGKAVSIVTGSDAVEGVRYQATDADAKPTAREEVLPATHVLLAAGCWSSSLYPVPISSLLAHSITIRPSATHPPLSPYALFTSFTIPSARSAGKEERVSPEIYTRPHNEVYVCHAFPRNPPLPSSTKEVEMSEAMCDELFRQVSHISPALASGEVAAKQACYLPSLNTGPGLNGYPMLGEVPSRKGLYIATGHTCWGISNGPGTARAISELIMDGAVRCAKLEGLKPKNPGGHWKRPGGLIADGRS